MYSLNYYILFEETHHSRTAFKQLILLYPRENIPKEKSRNDLNLNLLADQNKPVYLLFYFYSRVLEMIFPFKMIIIELPFGHIIAAWYS